MEFHQKINDFLQRGKKRAAEEAAKLEGRLDDLRAELENLGEARKEVSELPMTPGEVIALAKSQLQEGLQKHFLAYLTTSLIGLQNHQDSLSNDVGVRQNIMRDTQLWRLFFCIVEPEHIELAAKSLPPGVPAKERQRRLQEVDEKIAKLELEIEKILS
jgi:hypothetical protein